MKPIRASILRDQEDIAKQDSQIGTEGRATIAAFAIYVAGAAMTYGSQLVIARLSGSEGYGVYAYVLSWVTLLAYVATLGFNISILRFISAYRAQEAWPLIRGVIRYSERRAAVAGIAIAACGMTWLWHRSNADPPELRLTFLAGFGLVPVWSLLWIRCARIRAYGDVILGLVPDRFSRDGLVIALLGVMTFAMGHHVGAAAAMVVTLVSSIGGLTLATAIAYRKQPPALQGVSAIYATFAWRQSMLPLITLALGEVAMNRTGVVLLGWAGDTRAAGIYALAFNFGLMATLPRMAVNAWLAPRISALHARNERVPLQHMVTRASALTLAGAVLIALPITLLSGPLLAWFGRDFEVGIASLRILLLGQVITAALGSQICLLTMTGRENSAAIMLAIGAGLNAVLSMKLIAMFGVNGAAWASTISLIAWNAAMALFSWRCLDVTPGIFAVFSIFQLTSRRDASP